MTPGIWAVVPLKLLDTAKGRLAHVLDPAERRALMLAMARDVLGALAQARLLAGTLVVSRTPEADALAQTFGAERVAESPLADLSGALTQASDYAARSLGASGTMIVPADVPLITAAEVDRVLSEHGRVTIVPDDERLGTNCLVSSPPNAITLQFDGRSFQPHCDDARRRGMEPAIVESPLFALDIDTPADLATLIARAPECQTGLYLDKSGIAARLHGLDNGIT